MKKILFAGAFTLLSIYFSSCLTSLKHLATYQNIITDDKLVGKWEGLNKEIRIQKMVHSKYAEIFKEARAENDPISVKDSIFLLKHYIITFRDEKHYYTWSSALVRISNQTYVSLSAEDCMVSSEEKAFPIGHGFQNTHSCAKLEWSTNNTFTLHFLDGDYIKKIILSGKARIKHEYDPLFGTFVITASPEELEQFLEKYGNDERLYRTGSSITMIRKTR